MNKNERQTSNLTAADAATFLWGGAEEMDEAARAKWRNLVTLVVAGVSACVFWCRVWYINKAWGIIYLCCVVEYDIL